MLSHAFAFGANISLDMWPKKITFVANGNSYVCPQKKQSTCFGSKPDWILGCLTLTPLHTFCMIKMPPAKSNLVCAKSNYPRFDSEILLFAMTTEELSVCIPAPVLSLHKNVVPNQIHQVRFWHNSGIAFGYLSIQEILVITWPYIHLPTRPPVSLHHTETNVLKCA